MSVLDIFRRRVTTPTVALPVAGFADKAPPKAAWSRVIRQLNAMSDGDPAQNVFTMPKLLNGVLPARNPTGANLVLAIDNGVQEIERGNMAMDGGAPFSWGGLGGPGSLGPGLAFLGFPYLAELTQISEYRIPAEVLSTEMTRRWSKWRTRGTTSGSADKNEKKIAQMEARAKELKVRDLFREAALKCEWFGRSHISINIKGQDDPITRQMPLDIETVKKGSLLPFTCIEPYWMTPYSWNSTRPELPDFYRPQSWYIMGRKTHRSRLLTFIFREVPDLLKPAYDFSGISITQLMMPYVNRWLRTAKSVNDLINIFSMVTLSTDLSTLAQDDGQQLLARLQAFTKMRDNRGIMALNKTTEELAVHDASLGSLDKLQAQAQEHMATPGRLTLLKFFGITPSGLNATAEPEIQSLNDYVHSMQEHGYNANMTAAGQLIQMDLFGKIDPEIEHEWESLYDPTPKEKGEMRKADADRDGVYIEKSVVSPDEVRERLRTDPESGYTHLVGPAPEPMSLQEIAAGAEAAGTPPGAGGMPNSENKDD